MWLTGQLQLTTKKNVVQLAAGKNKSGKNGQNNQVNKDKVSKIGKNLTKSVNQAGKISLSTKPKKSALTASSLNTKVITLSKRFYFLIVKLFPAHFSYKLGTFFNF